MDLNSFNDVAIYITKENAKLSKEIADNFKLEMIKMREEFNSDLDDLQSTIESSIQKVDSEQKSQALRLARLEDSIARSQRNTELVISGIPVVVGESCVDIVLKIAVIIESVVNKESITAFRLNKTGGNSTGKRKRKGPNLSDNLPPLILVKFPSPGVKSDYLKKYLIHSNLCLTDIGFSSSNRIFVKENLTPSNHKIFQRCGLAKRDKIISKYHTKNGICYLAINDNDKPIAIHSLEQLDEILQPVSKSKQNAQSTEPSRKKAKLGLGSSTKPTRCKQQNANNLPSGSVNLSSSSSCLKSSS